MEIHPVYKPIPPLETNKILTNDGTVMSWTDTPILVSAIFSDPVTGVAPTAEEHFATKEYVDDSIGSTIDYYFNNTTSDINQETETTYVMNDLIEAGEETISKAAIDNTSDQLLFVFATLSGEPGGINLAHGVYDAHVHLAITGGGARSVDVYWTLSSIDDDGTNEVLIMTSETVPEITGGETEYTFHAILASDVTLAAGSRLLFKFFGSGNSGNDATMVFYVEGNTGTHLTIKVPSAIFNTIYLRLDGTTDMTGILAAPGAIFNGDVTNNFNGGGNVLFDYSADEVIFDAINLRFKDRARFSFGDDVDMSISYEPSIDSLNITSTGTAILRIDVLTLFFDKVAFTQIDGNEYIDSLADGYMDYGATTAHRFNNDIHIDSGGAGDTTLNFKSTGNDGALRWDQSAKDFYFEGTRVLWLEGDGTLAQLVIGGTTFVRRLLADDHFDFVHGASAGVRFFDLATDGENPAIRIYGRPTGDSRQYGQFQITTGPKFSITSGSGEIDFDNENLTTSGDIDAGSFTVGGVAGIDFDGAITNITIVKGIVTAAN